MKTSHPSHVRAGQVRTKLFFGLYVSFEDAHHADRIVKTFEAAVDLHIAESFLQCVRRQVGAEANLIQKFYQDLVHGIQTVCTTVDSRHQRMIAPMNVGLEDVLQHETAFATNVGFLCLYAFVSFLFLVFS